MPEDPVIPDKPAFKAAEVCELLKVPPYVLKSWENEFKDLGVSKTSSGARVYRRQDVERAVRIRHLVLSEGLTLAGVRRRLEEESGVASAEDALLAEIAAAARSAPSLAVAAPAPAVASAVAERWRQHIGAIREGLREVLDLLSRPVAPGPVVAAGNAQAAGSVELPRAERASRSPASAAARRPPARELVVEPDPAVPSLFTESDAEVAGEDAAAPEERPRGRQKSGRGSR